MEKTYRIPEQNVEKLTAAFVKLAKKAAKLGMSAISFSVVNTEIEKVKYDDGSKEYRRYFHISIQGDRPKIGGWEFVAALDHLEDGNLLREAPGVAAIPTIYRTVKPTCEHCRVQRYRLSTFVLRSDAGEYKQVGRQCLRDFLGHETPENVAKYMELLIGASELANDACGGGNVRALLNAQEFLAGVAACIRLNGWVSRKVAAEQTKISTADAVAVALRPTRGAVDADEKAFRAAIQNPEESDKDVAARAQAWAQQLSPDIDNDYLWNCRLAAGAEYLVDRQLGIAASIVPAYLREQGQLALRKAEADTRSQSVHFGTVGKRENFRLTLIKKIETEGTYGITTICKFVLEGTTNIATWFASGCPQLEEGQTYTIKGTVKEHKDYKGAAETVVTRCKIIPA